jgi:predicted DNA repair protein MutK
MAGSNLLTLIDDIATLLDDVAILSKVAAKKTAGVLGDDLALNAEQVSGVKAEREIPVVWAVAKGSFLNKLILVPVALALSFFLPQLITPLLMIGGGFLCYEGVEKLVHKFFHSKEEKKAHHQQQIEAIADNKVDMQEFEANKIKGAIRTDFILSAEIIVIALSTMQDQPFLTQVVTLSVIAIAITIGIYGVVAGIVKLDDWGLHLIKDQAANAWASIKRVFGKGLLAFAPFLMKALSIFGTAAMFLVGGGILVHSVKLIKDWGHTFADWFIALVSLGDGFSWLGESLFNLLFGIVAGAIILVIISLVKPLFNKSQTSQA